MVEKPTEGICSQCKSESLDFFDDGSGRCMNCGRTFRWASEEELNQETTHYDSPTQTRTSSQQPISQSSRTNVGQSAKMQGYTPSQRSERYKKPNGKKFLWLGVTGIVLMIVGYVLSSIFTMNIGLEEHDEIVRGIYILLTSVGVLMAGMGMLIFGSVADHLDENIRMGLIIASSLLIAIYLGLTHLSLYIF